MRLEDCRNLTVLVQLAYALGALVYLLWMVGIVGEKYVAVVLDFEVETSVYSVVCLISAISS